jgi:hypothetical protein
MSAARWLGGLGALLMLGLLAARCVSIEPAAVPAATETLPRTGRAAPAVPQLASAAPGTAALPGAPAVPPSTPAASLPVDPSVCGLGAMGPARTEEELEQQRERAEGRSTQAQTQGLLARLARHSGLHQLAALSLRVSLLAEQEMRGTGPECAQDDRPCADGIRRWRARIEEAYAGAAQQAAPMAVQLRDPAAYALVQQLCEMSGPAPPAACGPALLQSWADQDADNALPWLLLAAQQRRLGDGQAADEAVYRASQARRWSEPGARLHGLLASPEFAADQGWAGLQLQLRWGVVMSGLDLTGAGLLREVCSEAALRDANRWQRCDALTRLMVEQGSSLMSRVIGRRHAERLGWPAQRLAALDEHALALQRMQMRLDTAEADPFSCAALTRRQQRARAMASGGEVAWLDAQMRAQGLDRAQLALEYRDLRARLAATAKDTREPQRGGATR